MTTNVNDVASPAEVTKDGVPAAMDKKRGLSSIFHAAVSKGFTMYPVILLLVIVGSMFAPRFLTTTNIINILAQVVVLGLVTLGLTFVVLIGRLDLSLEAIVGFVPMVAAWLMVPEVAGGLGTEIPGWAGLLVAMALAAAIGWVNGFLVIKVGLNPFISTLGMLVLLRGAIMIVSNGRSIYSPPEAFTYLGSHLIGTIPISVFVLIAVALVVGVLFQYHRYGRALYAVGGNEDAARAAGINVDRIIWSAFIFAAMLAGLAGIILTGRLDSVVTTQGQGLIFDCFAAAVIGGVSLGGGPNLRLLVLDTPTRGLDVGAKSDVYSLVRDLAAQGLAVLLIADTLEEAIHMSHRVVTMRDGQISGEFSSTPGARPDRANVLERML